MRLKDITIFSPQYVGDNIDGDVSFVPMESLRNGTIDYKTIPFLKAKGKYTYFGNQDLLIAKVTPCFENGNIAIARNLLNGIGFGSSEIFVLRPNKEVISQYLFYLSQSRDFQDKACATMCGVGGLKRISPLFMRTYEFDMPSIENQQRMVTYLDTKLSEIEHQVSLLTSKRDAYLRLKKSIINHAVTRGLDPNVKMKDSGIEWIGEVPEHWEVKRMKDICALSPNIKSCSEYEYGSYLPMEGLRLDQIETSDELVSTLQGKYTPFEDNDLLVAKVTPCFENGNIAIAKGLTNGVGFGSSEIFVLRANKYNNIRFLFYMSLSSKFQDKACATMCGVGGLKRISPLFMKTYIMAIPPSTEQNAIATYLDDKCSKIETIVSNLDKQISRYGDLKRSLIDEVITGKRAV